MANGSWFVTTKREKLHLFDLDNDPYEENNMSEQEPELVKRLDEQITRWAKSVYSEVPDQFARKVRRTNKNNT